MTLLVHTAFPNVLFSAGPAALRCSYAPQRSTYRVCTPQLAQQRTAPRRKRATCSVHYCQPAGTDVAKADTATSPGTQQTAASAPAASQPALAEVGAGKRRRSRKFALSTALRTLGRAKQWRRARETLESMILEGLAPSQKDYSCVLKAMADYGRYGEALELLARMRYSTTHNIQLRSSLISLSASIDM
jgi:pentatricopeptide repeat protein